MFSSVSLLTELGHFGQFATTPAAAKRHQQSGNSNTEAYLIALVIRQEIALFEDGGSRGRHFQFIYDYLLTLPPSSVEADRAFSAAGIICSRLRTRLDDATVGNLCFLRIFFAEIIHSD